MRLKITQLIKKWSNRLMNVSALPAIDITLLRPFLILLAITILSYEAIDLFYKIISIPLTKQTAAVKNNVSSIATDNFQPNQLQDYGIITERNLFLSTVKAVNDKQSEGGLINSDENFMNIDLKGTVACDSSFGFIFIEERDSHKQKLYRIGDNIGSAKLIKITRNTATLRNEGREITLKVKATIEGSLLSNSPGRATSRNITLSKKAVSENLNDLKSIMNQAILRPFLNEGVQEGCIISNIAPNSLYEKMGLQNGDIIIDINNKPIQSADNLLQTVNLMQSGGNVTLNVKRNGRIEAINYSFN
jgi:general secretion pathway protein C